MTAEELTAMADANDISGLCDAIKDQGDLAKECAKHLCLIAADLRAAGDASLVILSSEGVAPASITLADELWLIALRLDGNEQYTFIDWCERCREPHPCATLRALSTPVGETP